MGLFDRFRHRLPESASGPSPLEDLLARLRDPDWRARKAAAEALGELRALAEPAVPALEGAISDEHGEVCLAASDALAKIRAAAH